MSYKCKYCGREFDSPLKLGGHMRWCKCNPDVEKSYEMLKNARKLIGYNHGENFKHKGEECECKYCHRLYKLYGLKTHEKYCENNPNRKEYPVESHKHYNEQHTSWKKGLTKETSEKVLNASNKLKERYKNGELTPSWVGRKHSDESKQKISDSLKRYYEIHPDEVGYKIHHSSNISYPEQYFMDVFKNEKIDLKYHLQVGLYELDFYNEENKYYVEIDGGTHKQQKVQEIDHRKDEYLKSLGWKGMRIVWDEYQKLNYEDKKLVISKIKNDLVAQLD